MKKELNKVAKDINQFLNLYLKKKGSIPMKTPVHVAVTGAAGQIGYALLFRIASGEMLGKDQPVCLHLLEITPALDALKGVVMELKDCAFPLLHDIVATDKAEEAFKDVSYALLVGARPRGPGMERGDLIRENGPIFVGQGAALAKAAAANDPSLADFLEECARGGTSEADLATMEKRGRDTGFTARHPLSGNPVPIYVANFVLMEYGTGAVMAVPGHDQRDWEFATKYDLPIVAVIADARGDAPDLSQGAYVEHGALINSGEFDGLDFDAAFQAIAARLESDGRGTVKTNFRLRDWGVARQRYWGAPIPVKYGPEGQTVPLTDDELPVALPTEVTVDASGSPLKKMPEFSDLGDGWVRDRNILKLN